MLLWILDLYTFCPKVVFLKVPNWVGTRERGQQTPRLMGQDTSVNGTRHCGYCDKAPGKRLRPHSPGCTPLAVNVLGSGHCSPHGHVAWDKELCMGSNSSSQPLPTRSTSKGRLCPLAGLSLSRPLAYPTSCCPCCPSLDLPATTCLFASPTWSHTPSLTVSMHLAPGPSHQV